MQGWDIDLFWFINRDGSNALLDYWMPVLSAIDAWLPVLGLILILAAWRGGKRARWMLLCLTLALVASDAVVGKTLKKTIGRVRPRDAMSEVIIRDVAKVKPTFFALFQPTTRKLSVVKKPATDGNSLPSNHTMNMFAAATVIALFFRCWGLPMYLLASAVAYSRIYVGAHWPSDVVVSIGLGVLIALGVVAAVRRVRPH